MIKNNSLPFEFHQLRKNFENQNEVFHHNSKILNEMIEKGKAMEIKDI